MTNLDLNITQGSTFEKTVTITGSDGLAVDISGFTFDAVITHRAGDTGVLETITTESGTPLTGGKVDLSLTHKQTANLPVTVGRWELEYTDRNDKKFKSHSGKTFIDFELNI